MHDPERDAARFLGDGLTPEQRDAFSTHLLHCPDCWREVEQARRGRALLESSRVMVPVELRDRVRALVEAEQQSSPLRARSRGWWASLAAPVAAAAALVVVVGLVGAGLVAGPAEPASLRAAVADYAAQKLPGAELPAAVAPDLSSLRLRPVGAGGGTYAGLAVDGYAYRDPAGRRVVLYRSDEPFPEAPGAEQLAGPDGPWVAHRGDVVILCARLPHALLVVGEDPALVRRAAGVLGVL